MSHRGHEMGTTTVAGGVRRRVTPRKNWWAEAGLNRRHQDFQSGPRVQTMGYHRRTLLRIRGIANPEAVVLSRLPPMAADTFGKAPTKSFPSRLAVADRHRDQKRIPRPMAGSRTCTSTRHARPRKRSARQDERMLRDVLGRPGNEPALIPAIWRNRRLSDLTREDIAGRGEPRFAKS